MHIVYVTWKFAQSGKDILNGGVANYLYKISKYMQRRGHSVTIVTVGEKEKRWQYDGIPVYTAKLSFAGTESQEMVSKLCLPFLREYAFRNALDIINREKMITLVQYTSGMGIGIMHDRKYPSILRVSSYSRREKTGRIPKVDYQILVQYEKMAAKRFNYIFAPSKVYAGPLSKEIKKKIVIIHTPYEVEEGMVEDESIYNKELNEKKYLLYFGRLSTEKGLLTIARCIRNILFRNPDYLLCFAGVIGKYKGESLMNLLKRSAGEYKDRVIYLGNLRHAQLYPIIRHAECVLLPSISDNLPNAALEAMLLNGIVIGTRGASFDEIYKDGESGLLMEIDNSDQLVEKINIVVSMSEQDKQSMRNKAKEVIQDYTFEKIGGKLEQYYMHVVSNYNCKKRKY